MPTVSEFLVERLENLGLRHVFGLPGDYALNFFDKLSKSPKIELIKNTDEAHSGFAADAYARVSGAGAVCVTYNVGALKILNAVACAYAERSPLVVISGSPGMAERDEGLLLHHMVRSFESQHESFSKYTCANTVLRDPRRAGYEIDRVIAAMKRHRQPVYIELPRDVADKTLSYDVWDQGTPPAVASDPQNLSEAINEVAEWIEDAKNPVILAGVQAARFGLGEQITKFAERTNIPMAATLLSKSIINETHPLYLGIYSGASSQPGVQAAIEESDCVLMFGVLLTDMTLTFRPARFLKRQSVNCSIEGLKVSNHEYSGIQFTEFMKELFKIQFRPKQRTLQNQVDRTKKPFVPAEATKITNARFFQQVDSILDESKAIVADIGDSLFGSADLTVHRPDQFLSPAYYTTMGFALPAALGVQVAKPHVRPIVLVGDGAFQMSCTELSTIAHRGLNPIVFVLNNGGYATERFLLDGKFNDVDPWNYSRVVELIGRGWGAKVRTETELSDAVQKALTSKELSVIEVVIDAKDVSQSLRRMTEGLSKRI